MKDKIIKSKDWKTKQNEYHAIIRHGQFVKAPKTYLLLFGGNAALIMGFIEQLDYQTSHKRKTRWMYITNDTFYRELMLTPDQVKTQVDILMRYGLLFKQLKGVPPINHYAINYEMTLEVAKTVNFGKIKKLNSGKLRNQIRENREILLLRKNKLDTSLLLDTVDVSTKQSFVANAPHVATNDSNLEIDNIPSSNGNVDIPTKRIKKKVDTKYIKVANKLANVIKIRHNINTPKTTINKWADELRKLDTINGVNVKRQKAAIKWYKTAVDSGFVIQSAAALRKKIVNVEAAMKRVDFNNKPIKNNFGHMDDFKLTKPSTQM